MERIQQKAKKIKLLILDVDGVLTDGNVHYNADGEVFETFTARDGKIIKKRLNELGITTIFDNQKHKMHAFNTCLKMFSVNANKACYIGDDILDMGPIKQAGLGCVRQMMQWIRLLKPLLIILQRLMVERVLLERLRI